MRVACSCGCHFASDELLAVCPYCFQPATLPVTIGERAEWEMRTELAAILADHEPGSDGIPHPIR